MMIYLGFFIIWIDCFALGVSTFFILTSDLPFPNLDPVEDDDYGCCPDGGRKEAGERREVVINFEIRQPLTCRTRTR